jgi:hypothetical protein
MACTKAVRWPDFTFGFEAASAACVNDTLAPKHELAANNASVLVILFGLIVFPLSVLSAWDATAHKRSIAEIPARVRRRIASRRFP